MSSTYLSEEDLRLAEDIFNKKKKVAMSMACYLVRVHFAAIAGVAEERRKSGEK